MLFHRVCLIGSFGVGETSLGMDELESTAGGADAVGDPATNAELLRNRAAWTEQALIRMRIPAHAVTEDAAYADGSYARRRITFRAGLGNGSGS